MSKSTDLFDYKDYKMYLLSWISGSDQGSRGARSRLARAAGCQPAYLTRVLDHEPHLSLEQAEACSNYIGHTEDQRKYFLFLVQYSRAGSDRLRSFFADQLESIKNERMVLKGRFKIKEVLSQNHQATYYSHWYFAAIHLLTSVGKFQTVDSIADYLQIPKSVTTEALDFLAQTGLVVSEKGRFKIGSSRIHLGSDSPFLGRHHTNWRLQAIRSFDGRDWGTRDNIHYTAVVSLSKDDFSKLRKRFVEMIEEFNEVVAPSDEQIPATLCLDFFRFGPPGS